MSEPEWDDMTLVLRVLMRLEAMLEEIRRQLTEDDGGDEEESDT